MPHISSKKLKRKVFLKISDEFINFLANKKSPSDIKIPLSELLTETERIMLAKRLALLIMLKKNFSFSKIANVLHVSPSTIERYWKETKKKQFASISQHVLQLDQTKKTKFHNLLGVLLAAAVGTHKRKLRHTKN